MTDPFEQELRARLQSMPEPRASIDADDVVREARRRRRPKVVGVTVTAVAACALVLTPVTIVAIDAIRPAVTATDAGGAPAPEAQEGGGSEDESAEAPTSAAPEPVPSDAGADAGQACEAAEAASFELTVAFLDDPADGTAGVEITNGSAEDVEIATNAIGAASVDADGGIVSVPVIVGDAVLETQAVPAGETVVVDDAAVATTQSSCGGAEAWAMAPFLQIVTGSTPSTVQQVVGTPWRA